MIDIFNRESDVWGDFMVCDQKVKNYTNNHRTKSNSPVIVVIA